MKASASSSGRFARAIWTICSPSIRTSALGELFALLAPLSREGGLLTKAAPYAVDRIAAVKRAGFALSPDSLIDWDGRVYGDYWTLR